ncbi:MAG TPA: phosphate ABC transporter substrate-binding protein PstS [Mycobacteriales bacterium]
MAPASALVVMLALAGCGTDNNAGASDGASSTARPTDVACGSGSLTASGSTAQANAMSEWTKDYQRFCTEARLNYGGGGSGKGVTDFTNGVTDFAGSDFPLTAEQKSQADARCGAGNQAIDLPMVAGPIAVGYNLPGVDSLNLSADTIANIFASKITKWNDPAISRDNPGVKLPSLGIQSFHRSDGSGTTFNFTNYLENDAGSAWTFGHGKSWAAPGGQGSKGTAGVAQGVKSTPGAIGYMELSYATENAISHAKVGNSQGQFVELTEANVRNFLSKATVAGSGDDLVLRFDYANTDPAAYPNVLVTYEIVCQKGNDPDRAALLKGFFGYLAGSGQDVLAQNGYVSLPDELRQKVQAAVEKIG